MSALPYVRWFHEISLSDLDQVGGKNASIGELINHLTSAGVRVPTGFATTAQAFHHFMQQNGLDEKVKSRLHGLNIDKLDELAKTGAEIRAWIEDAHFPDDLEEAVLAAYRELVNSQGEEVTYAVRSSATAEDLPTASFAGQQETFLNVAGEANILRAMKAVFASLYNDRAIAYREHQGFQHDKVALSVGIQRMVRADLAASGVMFTLDTETGYDKCVFITSSYGLGEAVVQGAVNPDEFYVFKENILQGKPAVVRRYLGSKIQKMVYAKGHEMYRSIMTEEVPPELRSRYSITDEDCEALARYALLIEKHYGRHMDIEWAKDGIDGKIYILQARPETVKSQENAQTLTRYELIEKGQVICAGRSIGQRIAQGTARVIKNLSELNRVQPGDVLVSDMTDPDWEPVMKRASAIVTNRGGRTCHAAIIARELGIAAVVGTGNATQLIKDGESITVSCAEGEVGHVYAGKLAFEKHVIDAGVMPALPMKVMLNVGNPERALSFQQLPNSGIGLARLEFIISNLIGIHPKALLQFNELDEALQLEIREKTDAYASPVEFYIEKLTEGMSTLAAAFHGKPVIVRLSDFKSNEYANLLGGELYEPEEENPMIGYRGASRYVYEDFKSCFALECEAVKRAREVLGFTNIEIMIPFVRTVSEAAQVCEILKENGLERGKAGLRIIMMCEIPSNALLAEEFLAYFDGFSIGSNDLTQLTLGLDRDSALVAHHFDERNEAVKRLLSMAIQTCKRRGQYIGICGQGPSDHKDFADWLMHEGIESVSLNPDSVIETYLYLAKHL